MKLLKYIASTKYTKDTKFTYRRATRGIVMNSEGKIALMNVSKQNYYKLPGGGIDPNEDEIKAFKREVMEETGWEIEDDIEVLGVVIQVWEPELNNKEIQYNICCKANATKELTITLTEEELERGFVLEWHSAKEALDLLKALKINNEVIDSMVDRDIAIVKEIIY
ncbi:MAG: NUDIX domain-containing protein [Ignavibacteriae bacterium]|nr:NUDIX domain-containing protein [Ignavibacteriota bacterium]